MISIKTIGLDVYNMVTKGNAAERELISSPIESVIYGTLLYKLFIASVLGTRLLRAAMIFSDYRS
jgi:hypothetical protein